VYAWQLPVWDAARPGYAVTVKALNTPQAPA